MRQFAALFSDLDTRTSTNPKVQALVRYYAAAAPRDAAWATYFLAGGRPCAVVNGRALREFAVTVSLACTRRTSRESAGREIKRQFKGAD